MRLFDGIRPLSRDGAARDALAGVTLASMNIPQVLGYTRIAGHARRHRALHRPAAARCVCGVRILAPSGRRRRFGDGRDFRERSCPMAPAGQRALHGAGGTGGAADRGAAAAGADFPARVPRRFPVADRARRVSRGRRHPGRHRHAPRHDAARRERASDAATARRARARRRRRTRADGDPVRRGRRRHPARSPSCAPDSRADAGRRDRIAASYAWDFAARGIRRHRACSRRLAVTRSARRELGTTCLRCCPSLRPAS